MAAAAARVNDIVVMQSPDFMNDGAGPRNDGSCKNGTDEPLFGDARWIEDRLEALRMREETGMRQETD